MDVINKHNPYKALTFDCYGTLIDWESGIWDAMQPLLMHNNKAINRQQGLEEFAVLETAQERETPDLSILQAATNWIRLLVIQFHTGLRLQIAQRPCDC